MRVTALTGWGRRLSADPLSPGASWHLTLRRVVGAEVQIDGSDDDGGGQMLRTAPGLAVVTGRGFEISRIRAGRRPRGSRPGASGRLEVVVTGESR